MDISPETSGTLFNGKDRLGVWHNAAGGIPESGTLRSVLKLRHQAFYFENPADNTDWAVPRGVIAAAWQPKTTGDDVGVGMAEPSGTSIRFSSNAGAGDGWVHLLTGSTVDLTETNDLTHIGRGTAGYVQPGFLFTNGRNANTLTTARVRRSSGYRLQVWPFTVTGTSDQWNASSTIAKPEGIVAVAWQPDDIITDDDSRVLVTLTATGHVLFTSGGADGAGWLWTWRNR